MIWNIKVWQTCKKKKIRKGGQHFFTSLYVWLNLRKTCLGHIFIDVNMWLCKNALFYSSNIYFLLPVFDFGVKKFLFLMKHDLDRFFESRLSTFTLIYLFFLCSAFLFFYFFLSFIFSLHGISSCVKGQKSGEIIRADLHCKKKKKLSQLKIKATSFSRFLSFLNFFF